jgi:hypothetical protein
MLGTTAALLTAAGIGAIGSGVSAAIGSSAAKSAAQTQTEASDKALDLQKEMYNTTRSDLSPWTTQGQKAATALGSLMGLDSVSGATSGSSSSGSTSTQTGSRTPTPNAVYMNKAVPTDSAAADDVPQALVNQITSTYPLSSVASTNPQTAAQAQTQSGYVTMRAPSGETQTVPSHTVNLWKSRGAVVVQ